jgi:hypothetical protein
MKENFEMFVKITQYLYNNFKNKFQTKKFWKALRLFEEPLHRGNRYETIYVPILSSTVELREIFKEKENIEIYIKDNPNATKVIEYVGTLQ